MTSASHRLHTSPPVSDRVETTTCYMCACRCGIRVHLRDGKVRFIDGNPIKAGLARYTNAPYLVVHRPKELGHGLLARDGEGNPLIWDRERTPSPGRAGSYRRCG